MLVLPNVKSNFEEAFVLASSNNSVLASSNVKLDSKQSMSVAASDLKRILQSSSNPNLKDVFVKKLTTLKNECVKMSNWPSLDEEMKFESRSNNNSNLAIQSVLLNESLDFVKSMILHSPKPSMTFLARSRLMLMLNSNSEWMRNSHPTETPERQKSRTAWLGLDMSERPNSENNLRLNTIPRKQIGLNGSNLNSNPVKHLLARQLCPKLMLDYATNV